MSKDQLKNDLQLKDKEDQKYKKPRMYKVIFFNDDFTTMEFVSSILMEIFHKSKDEADAFAMEVHTKGKAIAGVYTFEIAETKAAITMNVAHKQEFPLQVDIEPE